MNECSLCKCVVYPTDSGAITDMFGNQFCSMACLIEAYDTDIDKIWFELGNDRFERDGNYIYYHFDDTLSVAFGNVDGPWGYTVWEDGEARDSGETPSTNEKEIASWIINTVRRMNGIDSVAVL